MGTANYANNAKGGDGLACAITGTSTYYGGGGGSAYGGSGGNGGGGTAPSASGTVGTAGTTNTGGGGSASVKANSGGGGSGVVMVAYQTAASAPTITGITPGNGTLSVAFTAPSSNGGAAITNYKVSTDGGTTFTAVSPAATTSPITISGLTNGTAYTVKIRAVNAAGDGAPSTGVAGTPVTVPGAPTITGITPGNGTLSVAFTAPSSNGGAAITNYKVSTDGGTTFTAVSPAATTSPITISGLTNGTAYTVKIRAVNAAGDGAASTGVAGTPVTVPGAPTIAGITPGNGTLSVAFTAPSSNGGAAISNYKVSTDDGATFTAVSPAATTSPITISGLTNGTAYTVKILAVNAAGDGAPSTGVAATPVTVAGAPTIAGITPGNGTLSVAFTAPSSNGGAAITNYKVSTDDGATFIRGFAGGDHQPDHHQQSNQRHRLHGEDPCGQRGGRRRAQHRRGGHPGDRGRRPDDRRHHARQRHLERGLHRTLVERRRGDHQLQGLDRRRRHLHRGFAGGDHQPDHHQQSNQRHTLHGEDPGGELRRRRRAEHRRGGHSGGQLLLMGKRQRHHRRPERHWARWRPEPAALRPRPEA